MQSGEGKEAVVVDFTTCEETVAEAFGKLSADGLLARQERILVKPNLVNASPHPVTTPVSFTRAVIEYIRRRSDAAVIVAEGCGDMVLETDDVFDALGYRELARELSVELVDLNRAELRRLSDSRCPFLPEVWLPEVAFTHFIVSLPVLKAHSLSAMTGAMKNMVGFAPPEHYAGRHGSWKKATLHGDIHQAIIDLNRYRRPDLSIMDASVGLVDYHLGGPACDPPVGKAIAGFDPREVDRTACGFLGIDWRSVPHLASSPQDGS